MSLVEATEPQQGARPQPAPQSKPDRSDGRDSPFQSFLRSPTLSIPMPGKPPVTLATDRVRAKPAVTPQLSMMIGMTAIALGVWGTLFPRSVKRTLGVQSSESVVRAAFGARELWSGFALAADPTRTDALWARVAGDVVDLAVLSALTERPNPKRGNAKLALGFVAVVTALDVLTAIRMSTVQRNCTEEAKR